MKFIILHFSQAFYYFLYLFYTSCLAPYAVSFILCFTERKNIRDMWDTIRSKEVCLNLKKLCVH
jgi:hypothetical protein